MNCQECVKECREQTHKDIDTALHHKDIGHAMTLADGWWRCGEGHKVEPEPSDAMRAAGMEPML